MTEVVQQNTIYNYLDDKEKENPEKGKLLKEKFMNALENDPDKAEEFVQSKFKKINDAYRKDTGDNLDYTEFVKTYFPESKYSSVSNYKKRYFQNDEVKDMNDLAIADKVYDELLANKTVPLPKGNYVDFVNRFAPRYSKTAQIQRGVMRPMPYTREEIVEATGSATGREDGAMPTRSVRLATSLAINEKAAVDYLKKTASDYFGSEIDVRRNKYTNELEFFNPNLDKYQVVNTTGLDVGDLQSLTGDIINLTGEIVGTTAATWGGMFLTGPSVLLAGPAAAGAYYGTYASEIARVSLGNALFPGLNPEVFTEEGTNDEVVEAAKRKGGQAAMFAGAGVVAAKLVGLFTRLVRSGKQMTEKDLVTIVGKGEDSQAVVDEINHALDTAKVESKVAFNLGQATDDPTLKKWTAYLQNSDEFPEVAEMLVKQDAATQKAFVNYYKTLYDEFSMDDLVNEDTAVVSNKIKELLKDYYVNPKTAGNVKILNEAQITKENILKRLPKEGDTIELKKKTGEYIKQAIKKRDDETQAQFQKRYKEFEEKYAAGDFIDPFKASQDGIYNVDGEKIQSAVSHLMDSSNRKLSRRQRAFINNINEKFNIDTGPIQKAVKLISKDEANSAFKNFTNIKSFFDLGDKSEVSLKYLMNTMNQLKSYQRQISRGNISGDSVLPEGKIKTLIASVDETLRKGMPDSAYNAYKSIINDYAIEKKFLNKTLARNVETKEGRNLLFGEDIFDTSFLSKAPGYTSRIEDTFELLKNNPRGLQAYRRTILDTYRRLAVNPDGSIDQKASDLFFSMDWKNGGLGYGVKKFFGDDVFKTMKKDLSGLQKAITTRENKILKMNNEITSKGIGKFTVSNTDDLVKVALDPQNPKRLEDLMTVLKKDDKILTMFKTKVADRIYEGMINKSKQEFSLTAFNNFFNPAAPNSMRKAIDIVFKDNPGFLKGLDTMGKAFKIAERTKNVAGAMVKDERQRALVHLIRARVGMFTPEGRALTAAINMGTSLYKKRMAQILSDPDALEKLIRLQNVRVPDEVQKKGLKAVDDFLRKNQTYTSIVGNLFEGATGMSDDIDTPDAESIIEKNTPLTSSAAPRNLEQRTASLPVDIFAQADRRAPRQIAEPQVEQEPVVAQAPPRASGIGALNPQAQAQNFAAIFPEDTIGQAIAQKGTKFG